MSLDLIAHEQQSWPPRLTESRCIRNHRTIRRRTFSASVTKSAAVVVPAALEWMPLAIYASSPQGTAQAHVYQQLAVSRKGEIRGNYYDSISDAVQPLTGSIDREPLTSPPVRREA